MRREVRDDVVAVVRYGDDCAKALVHTAADHAVGRVDDAVQTSRAVHPRHGPGIGVRAVVATRGPDDEVAAADFDEEGRTDLLPGGLPVNVLISALVAPSVR